MSRRHHREILWLSVAMLAAAPMLQTLADGRVASRWFPGLVLPPTCMSRSLFDVDCPACGLTRSFVHLAHGDPVASFRAHRVGWLLMAVAFLQLPYRAHMLWGSGRYAVPKPAAAAISAILIVLLLGNWCVNVVCEMAYP